MTDPPALPPTDEPADGDGPQSSITPGAARRRLAAELRSLREAARRKLEEAGDAIERSAATISRYESGRYVPRVVDVRALLDYYHSIVPHLVTDADRRRILWLLGESKKKQWYSAFKNAAGEMISEHMLKFVEYETDAEQIRNYESDRIPGLLQISEYARAVAQIYFPHRDQAEHAQFAAFRLARQSKLRELGTIRLSFVVNEVALRRELGSPEILRAQLRFLVDEIIADEENRVELRVVPARTATPATMDGPFILMSFPEDSDDPELVYLETRSGATYLSTEADVRRFDVHFEDLKAACLPEGETVPLIKSIIQELPG